MPCMPALVGVLDQWGLRRVEMAILGPKRITKCTRGRRAFLLRISWFLPSYGSPRNRHRDSAPSGTMDLVRISLPQKLSRYINIGSELMGLLRETYGNDIDFAVAVRQRAFFLHLPDPREPRVRADAECTVAARERPLVLQLP